MAAKGKADLARIGIEGFAMLDDFLGSKPKPTTSPPPPPPPPPHKRPDPQQNVFHYYRYQPQQASTTVVHPLVIMSGSPQVSARKETVLDSYVAARIYGGTLIVDHHPKRERVMIGYRY